MLGLLVPGLKMGAGGLVQPFVQGNTLVWKLPDKGVEWKLTDPGKTFKEAGQ